MPYFEFAPECMIELAKELKLHPEISAKVVQARSFEEAMAVLGTELRILLDGTYNPEDLVIMLLGELRRKRAITIIGEDSGPRKDPRLVDITAIETSDSITLESVSKTKH